MTRLAGNRETYAFRLCRLADDGTVSEATEEGFDWPSVTTIISDEAPKFWMKPWVQKVVIQGIVTIGKHEKLAGDYDAVKGQLGNFGLLPDQIRDAAADRGTDAHTVLEDLCAGVPASVLRGTDGFSDQVIAWFEAEDLHEADLSKVILSGGKQRIWSIKHQVVGTPDLVRITKAGKRRLTDLKSREDDLRPRDGDKEQVSAYGLMWDELYPSMPIEEYSVLIATETGFKEAVMKPETVKRLRELFLLHREAFRLRKGI